MSPGLKSLALRVWCEHHESLDPSCFGPAVQHDLYKSAIMEVRTKNSEDPVNLWHHRQLSRQKQGPRTEVVDERIIRLMYLLTVPLCSYHTTYFNDQPWKEQQHKNNTTPPRTSTPPEKSTTLWETLLAKCFPIATQTKRNTQKQTRVLTVNSLNGFWFGILQWWSVWFRDKTTTGWRKHPERCLQKHNTALQAKTSGLEWWSPWT